MNNFFEIEHAKRTGYFSMLNNHIHDNYEIYYLLSGTRFYFIKDRTYLVEKGDMVFVDKYDVHRTIINQIKEHERIVINFKEAFLAGLYGTDDIELLAPFVQEHKVLRIPLQDQSSVENILFRILKESQDKPKGYEMYTKTLLVQLLLYSNRTMDQANKSPVVESGRSPHKKVSEIVEYINHHYDKSLTLSHIAGEFYLSTYYLSRIFKQVTGFTLIEYRNMVRIKEAQKLLRETDWKIIRIAGQVGFDNIAHFGRVFHSLSNCSPGEYRKINK